jgi:hypothetical protein
VGPRLPTFRRQPAAESVWPTPAISALPRSSPR